MGDLRSCRIDGAVLWLVPYGDEGAVEVWLRPHAYLACFRCGDRLDEGVSAHGAQLWICHGCERILDQRRVA